MEFLFIFIIVMSELAFLALLYLMLYMFVKMIDY